MAREKFDDLDLLRLFIAGNGQLASNESLKVQVALDTHQLLTRNGKMLAIARMNIEPPEIQVRPQSSYAELLSKTLQDHQFYRLIKTKAPGSLATNTTQRRLDINYIILQRACCGVSGGYSNGGCGNVLACLRWIF